MSRQGRKHKRFISHSPEIGDFNHGFNARRKGMERWHNIIIKLSEFEGFVNNYDEASPDEIQTLKAIHEKIYDCCLMAKKQFNDKSIGEDSIPTTRGFYEIYNLLGKAQGIITEGTCNVVRKISALTEVFTKEPNQRSDDLTKKFCPLKLVLTFKLQTRAAGIEHILATYLKKVKTPAPH